MYKGLGEIVCREVNGTTQCVNTDYTDFEKAFPSETEPLPCEPTDAELAAYGGRVVWNSLDPATKWSIGMAICSRHPTYGSVLTLAARIGYERCITGDELAQAGSQNDAVANYVRLGFGGDYEAAAAAICGLTKAQIDADVERLLGYYGVPLAEGGVPVGSPYYEPAPGETPVRVYSKAVPEPVPRCEIELGLGPPPAGYGYDENCKLVPLEYEEGVKTVDGFIPLLLILGGLFLIRGVAK